MNPTSGHGEPEASPESTRAALSDGVTEARAAAAAGRYTLDELFEQGVARQEVGDVDAAHGCLLGAAAGGHTGAMVALGALCESDEDVLAAAAWYRRAAERGDIGGMREVGRVEALLGEEGSSLRWLWRAAEGGDICAMSYLVTLGAGDGDAEG